MAMQFNTILIIYNLQIYGNLKSYIINVLFFEKKTFKRKKNIA